MREKWHKATAMIVESHDNPPDAVGPAFHVSADVHEYVIEVVGPQGPRRVTVAMFSRFVHEAGALIYVEISGKTGEVKVDHDAMSEVAVQLMKDHPEAAPGYARRRQLPDESPASTSLVCSRQARRQLLSCSHRSARSTPMAATGRQSSASPCSSSCSTRAF